MDEYTESFAAFILECKAQYEELCRAIDNGEVPSGHAVTISVDIPAGVVDVIRFDRLAAAASDG